MRQKFLLLLSCLLLLITRILAQENCSEFVEAALATAQESCLAMGRNQACYGHSSLSASAQADALDFQFASIGDVTDLATIQSLQLSPYDSSTGQWGVVLMQIQANVPNTLPGQNVTVLLFGEVGLWNAAISVSQQVPPEAEQSVRASGNVNVRAFPGTGSAILGTLSPGVSITANGRTENAQWIRVRFGEATGWIFAPLLEGDTSGLLVVNPTVPQYGPMQAFYLSTGIGRPSCNQVPDDGMLVQTPEGIASIHLLINEVSVEMGSTVYLRIDDEGRLQIAPLEGSARLTVHGQSQTIVEGGYLAVPLTENLQPAAEASVPQSYLGDENIASLSLVPLVRPVELDPGLEQAELDLLLTYEPVLDFLHIEDADEFLVYLTEVQTPDVPAWLLEAGYEDFGDELEVYFEENLGYELDNYPNYTGDDEPIYYEDSFEDADGDGLDDTFDDFVDMDGDGIEDSLDDWIDGDGDGLDDRSSAADTDGDGVDDAFDDFVDSNGDGVDDRSTGTDADGDGTDDAFDDFVDSDGDGIDDRTGGSGTGIVDADSDGIDDNSDDWVDTDGDGLDDRTSGSGEGNSANPNDGNDTGGSDSGGNEGVDADGDGIDDSVDDWVDIDGDGIDDRS